ncbi:uncharacterized protein LOC143694147 isoform X2 [Agelaius phoeniceus]|uniref:uncharacterized protein LOC143694147 isoform X2 n=1 Tax=Agelaius phoeniceus TaxID=39638 RepID=UPI004054C4DD
MPTTVELGATWGKQEQERVHGVKCAFHQTFAPQVKQAVPRWAFVLPWHANSCSACLMNKPAIRLMLQVTLSSTKLLRPQQILILKKGTIDHQG